VEALELIGRNGYDLVITDFEMPGMKGDELAATIKIRIPSIPVIMITAYAEMFEGGKRPLPGVDSLLSKPFPLSGLRSAIAKAFQGGKPA
jgi:CheY-like chemotaxis protein